MSTILTILAAIAVFLIVVLFHELGHFVAAKLVGIKVNEFSVGMGPALVQKQSGETLYSVRLLPLGGYCAMEGEDEDSIDPRGYDQAKPWQRFITILAGPLMNLLIAIIFFTIFSYLSGAPNQEVASFPENSPLEEAGLEIGDKIVSINEIELQNHEHLQYMTAGSDGEELEVAYQKEDGSIQTVRIDPMEVDGQYILGFTPGRQPISLTQSLADGLSLTWATFTGLFTIIGMLFTGQLGLDAVSGPVGVVTQIGQVAASGLVPLLFFTAYISVNLAFFNLLPIPALDGSKLLLILVEKLRGRPMKKETEAKITIVGFMLLMGLILVVSIKDIVNLF